MRCTRAAALSVLLLSLPATGRAQDDADAPQADQPDGPLQRLIYLPYEDLKETIGKTDAAVFVPYLEYLELWKRSQAGQRPLRKTPPVDAVLSSADYTARVEGDHVRIAASLEVEVLRGPWASVPLDFGNAAVGKVGTPEGQPKALLRGVGDGRYELLLPEAGTHTVSLELEARVRTSPEGRYFDLQVPTVGITTLEVVVPEADQTIEVEPERVTLPVEVAAADDAAGQTRVRASLGATSKITARWSPEAGMEPEMELLVSADNLLHVALVDGLVRHRATLDYHVLRGNLSQARVLVPQNARILDVTSPNARIESWKAEADGPRQVLTVELLSPAEKTLTLEVLTEQPQPQESFAVVGVADDGTVRGIHAADVVRESGRLVVSHGPETAVTVADQRGLVRIEAGDVPQELRLPNALSYRFFGTGVGLDLTARPVEPRIVVQQDSRLVFQEDELRLNADLAYEITRSGVFELKLRVPDGLVVDDVVCDVAQEFHVDEQTGTLRITLDEKRQADVSATVVAHRDLEREQDLSGFTLPLLEPLDVFRETGRVFVYAPPAIEVTTREDELQGVRPESTENAPGVANARVVSAWSYNRRPVTVVADTSRKPTRLTARIGTELTTRRELAEVATRIAYRVEYAGVDTFRFALPESVGEAVQIKAADGSVPVKERTRSEQAQDGWITWTVVTQREVTGEQVFEVTYDLQPASGTDEAEDDAADAEADDAEADADDATADGDDDGDGGEEQPAEEEQDGAAESAGLRYVLRPARVLGLDAENGRPAVELVRVVGEAVVARERALAVQAEIEGDQVEPIDVRELEFLAGPGGEESRAVAFRYFAQPVTVTVSVAEHEIQEVVETVVSRALVETVLGQDGQAHFRCRYRMESSERQRLAVHLPNGMESMGVTVNGRAVDLERDPDARPREGWQAFSVNVTRETASDQPFSLTLLFRVRLAPFEMRGGPLELRLPKIGGDAESVVVQQLRTVLWVPQDYVLVGTPDGFVNDTRSWFEGWFFGPLRSGVTRSELESWIGVSGTSETDFPTDGHAYAYSSVGGEHTLSGVVWWDLPFFSWIVSGALVLIAFVLRNTGWENKLGILVVLAFAGGVYALRDPDTVVHALAAARFGLAALLVIWLIYGIAGRRHVKKPPAGRPHPMGPPVAVVVPPPGVFEELQQR